MKQTLSFASDEHKKRFIETMQEHGLVSATGELHPIFAAPIYIFTCDETLYQQTRPYITKEGIRFAQIQQLKLGAGHTSLVKWGSALYDRYSYHCDPDEILWLNESMYLVALGGLFLRRYSTNLSHLP